MAIMAYIFFPIPFIFANKNQFARYHVKQDIILLITFILFYLITWILTFILELNIDISYNNFLKFIIRAISILPWIYFILMNIIGIVNVSKGRMKPLPFIGKFSFLIDKI